MNVVRKLITLKKKYKINYSIQDNISNSKCTKPRNNNLYLHIPELETNIYYKFCIVTKTQMNTNSHSTYEHILSGLSAKRISCQ